MIHPEQEPQTPPKLFVADDILKTSKALQDTIAEAPRDLTRAVAQNAIDVLGDVRTIYGAKKLALHAMSAFIINRGLTTEEQALGTNQYGEIIVKALFGGIQYVRTQFLSSLCLDLYDPRVLHPVEEDDPQEGRLITPLLVPVYA